MNATIAKRIVKEALEGNATQEFLENALKKLKKQPLLEDSQS